MARYILTERLREFTHVHDPLAQDRKCCTGHYDLQDTEQNGPHGYRVIASGTNLKVLRYIQTRLNTVELGNSLTDDGEMR